MTDSKIGFPDLTAGMLSKASMDRSVQGLQNLSNKVNGVKDKQSVDKVATEDAARQFEGLLVQQMLKSMWDTIPKDGIFSASKEESLYRDMLNQAYAEELTKGQGIGIKGLVAEQLNAKKYSPEDK